MTTGNSTFWSALPKLIQIKRRNSCSIFSKKTYLNQNLIFSYTSCALSLLQTYILCRIKI
jgi:hypothetical protein